MDNNSRATRFLIDRIDSKLGSVEKELKFDKIAIGVGLAIMVISAFVLGLAVDRPALAVLCLMLIIFGFFLAYVMVKEYIDDLKKAKKKQ